MRATDSPPSNRGNSSSFVERAASWNATPVGRKPPVSRPNKKIEPRETEQEPERPGPPNPARQLQVDIGTRVRLALGCQEPDVAQGLFLRHPQRLRDPISLKNIDFETPAPQGGRPELKPTYTECALAVEKHPTHPRRPSRHVILVPLNTVTGDPSTRKAEAGLSARTAASSAP